MLVVQMNTDKQKLIKDFSSAENKNAFLISENPFNPCPEK